MILRERFETTDFSSNEQIIVDYILDKKMAIKDMTTKDIAQATYTSPSSLIRIAHKMHFAGWNELKEAYLNEESYLETHFKDIDANIPFKNNDTIMSIASKIAALEKESIEDTLSLITHDDLQKCVQIIRKSSEIQLFAASNNLMITKEFRHNMSRIKKRVNVHSIQSEIIFNAYLADEDSCALVVSYSGETRDLNRCVRALKEKRIPVIAITSIGNNTLSSLADCVLHVTTREKLYSKIATYTTDTAITYLLDVIYSCVFALDYDKNLSLRIDTAKAIESGRSSSSVILQEEDNTFKY